MISQPVQQTLVIHILTNTSRNKGSQAMKFCQLIEYNLRNVFIQKSYTKCGRETIPRPFFKKSKFRISLDQYFKVLNIFFLLFAKLRTIEID